MLTTTISGYTRRISRLQGEITVAAERASSGSQTDLDAKRAELERLQDDLRRERARLVRLRARLAEARATLRRRLVEIYKADAARHRDRDAEVRRLRRPAGARASS